LVEFELGKIEDAQVQVGEVGELVGSSGSEDCRGRTEIGLRRRERDKKYFLICFVTQSYLLGEN